ncbi:uncharacterized protein LOC111380809 isoform X2 [Olea europaea var. sylvestris]|uniref:uncharacterized protein LOC111380809 isoform X2 n=1 Tax=Olea europaea var. sylvestris TaxID=158386 RepID=UPI000C1CFB98|nr:uncharacterized protein LOC111380809 isoform X2 [Olea europaea var. sylvestris]
MFFAFMLIPAKYCYLLICAHLEIHWFFKISRPLCHYYRPKQHVLQFERNEEIIGPKKDTHSSSKLQISNALAGATADKKDLMRKLPKFIYDEEKALERQRKKLAEKIEQLNSAIDNMSNQLRADEPSNGAAVNVDDMEVLI